MPLIVGRKTTAERFAGATNTYTLEAMMRDGKALQMGTSHELGQNFAKAFGIEYTSDTGSREHAWTTSWGSTTRMIGGMIMCHGDDNGLRVPPRLAPIQAHVMVVKSGDAVPETAAKLRDALRDAGVRVGFDDRTDTPFGRRAVDAELKGYPIRVEVGPRDLAAGNVVLARRATGGKTPVPVDKAVDEIQAALAADQQALYDQALAFREARTVDVTTAADAVEAAATGFARIPWSTLGTAGEAELNKQAVTVRCLVRADGSVPDSEDEPDLTAYVARSY
jgi:prolyl-tRNA synthetase